ncbi:hypothetical protein C8R46DRAFT_1347653 [Mycena filopes]|nr:hypothetical protein C8R46DRAFT_1347653 [Mycena filopes]
MSIEQARRTPPMQVFLRGASRSSRSVLHLPLSRAHWDAEELQYEVRHVMPIATGKLCVYAYIKAANDDPPHLDNDSALPSRLADDARTYVHLPVRRAEGTSPSQASDSARTSRGASVMEPIRRLGDLGAISTILTSRTLFWRRRHLRRRRRMGFCGGGAGEARAGVTVLAACTPRALFQQVELDVLPDSDAELFGALRASSSISLRAKHGHHIVALLFDAGTTPEGTGSAG